MEKDKFAGYASVSEYLEFNARDNINQLIQLKHIISCMLINLLKLPDLILTLRLKDNSLIN